MKEYRAGKIIDKEFIFYFPITMVVLAFLVWVLSIGSGIPTNVRIGIIIFIEIIYVVVVIFMINNVQKSRNEYFYQQSIKRNKSKSK
jgi:hypothetical protein